MYGIPAEGFLRKIVHMASLQKGLLTKSSIWHPYERISDQNFRHGIRYIYGFIETSFHRDAIRMLAGLAGSLWLALAGFGFFSVALAGSCWHGWPGWLAAWKNNNKNGWLTLA